VNSTTPAEEGHDMQGRTGWDRAAIGLSVFVLLLTLLAVTPYIPWGGDDARYYLIGKAIWTGLGPRALWVYNQPIEPAQPYGWPLLLGLVTRPFEIWGSTGAGIQAAHVLASALWGAATYACYRFACNFVTPGLALVVAALTGLSYSGLMVTTAFLSEPLFMLCSLLSLDDAVRAMSAPESRRLSSRALWWAVAAFFVRIVGLATFFGAAVVAWKRSRRALIITTLVILAWPLYGVLGDMGLYQTSGGVSYTTILVSSDPLTGGSHTLNLVQFAARSLKTLYGYAAWTSMETIVPINYPRWSIVIFWLVSLTGAVMILRRHGWKTLPVLVMTVFYFGAISSHYQPTVRFLLPIIPLYGLLFCAPLDLLLRRSSRMTGLVLPLGLLLIVMGLLTPNILEAARTAREMRQAQSGWPSKPEFRAFFEVAAWSRDHLPPASVVAVRTDATFYMISGHHTVSLSPDSAAVSCRRLDELSRTRPVYVIDLPRDQTLESYAQMVAALAGECGSRMETVEAGVVDAVVYHFR
jgi:hypothetical protein